jgi:hypothetical protein
MTQTEQILFLFFKNENECTYMAIGVGNSFCMEL